MDVALVVSLLAAGFTAGAVNAMAGGGTLITLPVLVASGMPARTATITSAVGLLPGYAGGSVAYRRELKGSRDLVAVLAVVVVSGALAGSAALLLTSDRVFRSVVPYLVLGSCVLLAVQPRVARAVERRRARGSSKLALVGERGGLLLSSVYGAYFGAGMGALFLAVLGIFINQDLQRLNALKGLLSLMVSVVSVGVFVAFGAVEWEAALWLAIGAWTGGAAGVRAARRMRASALRGAVVVLGVAVAVVLIVRG